MKCVGFLSSKAISHLEPEREKIVDLQWESPKPFGKGGRRKKMLPVCLCHIISKKQTGKGAEGQDPP